MITAATPVHDITSSRAGRRFLAELLVLDPGRGMVKVRDSSIQRQSEGVGEESQ